MRFHRALFFTAFAVALVTGAPFRVFATGFDDRVKNPVDESIRIRQHTQKQEEQWRDDRQKLVQRYERLEHEHEKLMTRQRALLETTSAARARVAAKQKQLADIEQIQSSITPLIDTLVEELRRHLEIDPPFLPDERRQRLERLEAMRLDPDVAVSEKFRKAMEALLVEAEYGNTIEVYQQSIAVGERPVLVNIFRLGRVSLFFQTLDQKSCGFFNVSASAWQPLPAAYNRSIQIAMDIGAKRRPAELLTLPLGRIDAP